MSVPVSLGLSAASARSSALGPYLGPELCAGLRQPSRRLLSSEDACRTQHGNVVLHTEEARRTRFEPELGDYALIALALLHDSVRRLSGSTVAGFAAAVALGLSPTFWRYATVAEVFAGGRAK